MTKVLDAWTVADTTRTDRKDFFCLSGSDQRHIGTLISGSRCCIDRFERDVALMRKCPEMMELLLGLVNEVKQNPLDEDRVRALGLKALAVLDDVSSPYKEG